MERIKEKFEQWAIVELFGHQRIAGKVTEQTIGGCSFVRVDVPAIPEQEGGQATQAFTKLFGQGAIYGMSFVDEDAARLAASQLRVQPIDGWSLRQAIREIGTEGVQRILGPPERVNYLDDEPDDDLQGGY